MNEEISARTACPYCGLRDHTGREHMQFVMSLSDTRTGGSTPESESAPSGNAPSRSSEDATE